MKIPMKCWLILLTITTNIPHQAFAEPNSKTTEETIAPWEYLLDAGLLSSSVFFHVSHSESDTLNRSFPTQKFDDQMRQMFHGQQVSKDLTKKEKAYALTSDLTLAGLVVTPVLLTSLETTPHLRRFVTIAHGAIINNFVTTALKYMIGRARPKPYHLGYEKPAEPRDMVSFPSGHSSNAFYFATITTLLFPEMHVAYKSSLFLLASVVGFSRIAADQHFFTDVMVGTLIGISSAYFTVKVMNQWTTPAAHQDGLSWLVNPTSLGFDYRF